jgi:thiosulfate/3-mercaptopyruvate sulfurtransferase
LPDFNLLVKKLAAWGISTSTQVVAYDDAGGAFAGRLWWLLRCLGHEQCAVLNGGIKHWQSLGLPVTTALPQINPGRYRPYMNSSLWLNARELENAIARKNICLMDARTPERYQGTQEPVDPIAGHIPYAINRPFQLNLDKNGLFLPADLLSSQFRKLTGTTPPEQVIHYCGSGITACHNLLAMEYANLKNSKLYAGSWSEWIKNKNRAVVTAK